MRQLTHQTQTQLSALLCVVFTVVENQILVNKNLPRKSTMSDTVNKDVIVCSHCPSKILLPGKGNLEQKEFALPKVARKSVTEEFEQETVNECLAVPDMYDFENIGFSKTVGNVKYLTCADCEIGPVGWHCLDTKTSYIALSRVKKHSSG